MAQRKKKLTKKKRQTANREPEADSDSGDFELAAEVKDDDSVSNNNDKITHVASVRCS